MKHAQRYLTSNSNAKPMTSLGGHGNDHFMIRDYVPLASCVVQLQRTALLAAVKVVPVEDRRQHHAHFTAHKLLATAEQSGREGLTWQEKVDDLTRRSFSTLEKRQ